MKRPQITGLYYITHVDNVPSILKYGILSHERIISDDIQYEPIYDKGIVEKRQHIETPEGKPLWHYANLYFQARNPMLYRVMHEKDINSIAVVAVGPEILDKLDIFITTGNAAHSQSEILSSGEGRKRLRSIVKDTNIKFWKEQDGSKRRIMSECLVPNKVEPDLIHTVYVPTKTTKDGIIKGLPYIEIPIVIQPDMFFRYIWASHITNRLYLAKGDMFFSKLQTITISVNTVGIMGRGLASRARYQFSDVYVHYEDLCRERKLKMGRPQIYKRESSLDEELSDEPKTLKNGESGKWFLLFPTKKHWRERADIKGIEEGLQWLSKNYKAEDIKSLAIPALGCGLGRLDWRDVGPLMCKYLKDFEINVGIYLPTEKEIPGELLTKEFLLSRC